MAYQLKKVSGGYKVQSEGGTFLSKHALSKEHAEKQKIAATLSYLRKEKKIAKRK